MNYDDIPGWFVPVDQAAFAWILGFQNRTQPAGALVDMGAFKGKSAILIGNHLRDGEVLTVCDLFEDIATSEKADERERQFFETQSLTQSEFERNYLAFHKALPRIVRAPTAEITRHVAPGTARFVHIDAGHTYSLVREDLDSARVMLRESGVVVFEAYRKPETLGVTAVVWEGILNEGLKPFLITTNKLYATWGNAAPFLAEIERKVAEVGWCRLKTDVMVRDMPVHFLSRKG